MPIPTPEDMFELLMLCCLGLGIWALFVLAIPFVSMAFELIAAFLEGLMAIVTAPIELLYLIFTRLFRKGK